MAIRTRRLMPILILLAALCMLSLGAGFALSNSLSRIDGEFTQLVERSGERHRALQQLGLEFSAQHRAYLNLLITEDAKEQALFRELIIESRIAIDRSLDSLKNLSSDSLAPTVDSIRKGCADYHATGDELLGMLAAGDERKEAVEFRRAKLRPIYQELSTRLASAGDLVATDARKRSEELSDRRGSLRTFALALLGWPAALLSFVAIAVGGLIWLTTRLDEEDGAPGEPGAA